MKAISVRQPWAWAIIHAGKNVENRTRFCTHRGPLLIHASKHKPTKNELHAFLDLLIDVLSDERAACLLYARNYERITEDRGGIVGQVDVVGCVTHDETTSPWFCGPYGLVLANPKPLPFREYKGRLGLFEVE